MDQQDEALLREIEVIPKTPRGSKHNRKKRPNYRLIRRAVTVAASVVLALSVLATGVITGYVAISEKRFGNLQTDGNTSETGSFEQLNVSEHSGVSYILVLGVDLDELLTDVMVLVCMDHEKNTISCLQIPRDTYVGKDIPSSKINAVYGNPREGELKINGLRRRLSADLGIPVDHYVIFTVEGFRNCVDALGGIDINITQENGLEIENQDTYQKYTIGPGWVTLDGNMAAGVVRKRYGSEEGYGRGDPSRLETQRLVYVALCKKLQTMNMSQMSNIAGKCYGQIKTDISFNDVIGYAMDAKSVPLENFRIFGLPGQSCWYKKVSYYSIHKDDYVSIFNTYFNPYGQPLTEHALNIKELYQIVGDQKVDGDFKTDGGSIAEIIAQQNQ